MDSDSVITRDGHVSVAIGMDSARLHVSELPGDRPGRSATLDLTREEAIRVARLLLA